ncbi:hypothetical protein DID76_01800 [Candidatus Marinamargulisbacteria bacterium SCGC AG-414-C22]|nr:hypothetical protein DID76_01800 [Candidatus Marinamargulisbacteria bacterium SCGC AG-414-C22]
MSNIKKQKPEIITYCGNEQQIDIALAAGADHLILEHSQLSIRSWKNVLDTSFKQLESLINYVKRKSPNTTIAIQCDLIMHQHHESVLMQLVSELNPACIDYIRVQDAGVLVFFKQQWPAVKTCFIQEMGNANTYSIQSYAKHAERQQLSLDLTYDNVKTIQQTITPHFEWLVQGPILIQHSLRRFMFGLDETDNAENAKRKQAIHRIAQDEDYPGRYFTFYDNEHGHFMYAYFDRSLLKVIPDLVDLGLSGWIIDARGESEEYLAETVAIYKDARDTFFKSPKSYQCEVEHLNTIKKVAKRAQKVGFFKANQTDRQRYGTHLPSENEYIKVGRVLDIKKGSRITIDCTEVIHKDDTVYAFHPKTNGLELHCLPLWDIANNVIELSDMNSLVQIPWAKGIQQNSIIYKKLPK